MESESETEGRMVPVAGRLAGLVIILVLIAALVWACIKQGPRFDEYFAWYQARPDRGFSESLAQSWLAQGRPPLFYMLIWAARQLTDQIEVLRLVNLGILVLAAAGALILMRGRSYLAMGAAFLMAIAANQCTLENGAGLNSCFLSLSTSALVMLGMTIGWIEGSLLAWRQRVVVALALIVGLNIDMATTVVLCAFALPFAVMARVTDRKALFWQIVLALVPGLALFVASMVLGQGFAAADGDGLGVRTIGAEILSAYQANIALLVLALCGFIALLVVARLRRQSEAELEVLAMSAIGLVLAGLALFATGLMVPIRGDDPLSALVAGVALTLAVSFAAGVRVVPPAWGAACVSLAAIATLPFIANTLEKVASQQHWDAGSAFAARIQSACPDAAVHIDPGHFSPGPADKAAIMTSAQSQQAQQFGIRLEAQQSRRVSRNCPTLFWAEEDRAGAWGASAILTQVKRQGFAVSQIFQYRTQTGWIASDRPLS